MLPTKPDNHPKQPLQSARPGTPRMSQETKFGYGFLLVGTGTPFLISELLGLRWAIVISVACTVVGVAFLVSGHRHKETAKPKTIWEWLAVGGSLCTSIVLISIGVIHAVVPLRASINPSLAYVVGGFWSPAPQEEWVMMIRHYGPDPINNIEMVFTDENIRKAQSESGAVDVSKWERILHFDELDPTESVYAKEFPWKTLNPDDENYTVVTSFRQGFVIETLHLRRINGKWFYAMRITDRAGKQIVSCSDAEMGGPADLPKCFPDYTTKHLGN
jgi:hypothetical protein